MTEQTARALLTLNEKGYQIISKEFSQTRVHIWEDLQALLSYVKEGMDILDVGCGNGRLFELFKDMKVNYVGMDLNPQFIKEAQKKYANDPRKPQFIEGDLLHLANNPKVADKRFHLIFCVAVLNHIPTKQFQLDAFKQMALLLRGDGHILMTNWNLWRTTLSEKSFWRYNLERIKMSQQEWQKRFGIPENDLGVKDLMTTWKSNATVAPLYYYSFTLAELSSLCGKAGLHVVEKYYSHKGQKRHWWNGRNSILIASLV